jgi:hypothetical protein
MVRLEDRGLPLEGSRRAVVLWNHGFLTRVHFYLCESA